MAQKIDGVLPNLIGIGACRSGSSWLYEILKSHPKIYMSETKKELNFFNFAYKKGLDFYKTFFPSKKDSKKYDYIGEFSPMYMYDSKIPARIKKDIKNPKFIVILRDPVTRLYSSYKKYLRDSFLKYPIGQFIKDNPEDVRYGLYNKNLDNWFKLFPKKSFYFLYYEELEKNPNAVLSEFAKFLDIDPKGFDQKVIGTNYNASAQRRFHYLFVTGIKLVKYLHMKNMNGLAHFLESCGKLVYGKGSKKSKRAKDIKVPKPIMKEYVSDIKKLEKRLNKKFDNLWEGYRINKNL